MICENRPVRIVAPAGVSPEDAYRQHLRAAQSEGCCPWCGCWLEPIETPRGIGGMCRHCDHAWWMDEIHWSQWRLHNPFTGESIPMA